MTTTDPTLAGLLRAVLATPDDDLPRLVYADRLEENGEPEQAEFIRVQCELARLPELIDVEQACTQVEWHAIRPHHPKYTFELTDRKNRVGVMRFRAMNPALDALRELERELRSRHQGTWFAQAIGRLVYPANLDYEFRHGFVEAVSCDLATFLGGQTCRICEQRQWVFDKQNCVECKGNDNYRTPGIAPRLFALQPVTKVTLSDREPYPAEGKFYWSVLTEDDPRAGASGIPDCLREMPGFSHGPFDTADDARDHLSKMAVAYGRANAEGMSHEAVCPKCKGEPGDRYGIGLNCVSVKHGGCDGKGTVRKPGLPPLAGITRERAT